MEVFIQDLPPRSGSFSSLLQQHRGIGYHRGQRRLYSAGKRRASNRNVSPISYISLFWRATLSSYHFFFDPHKWLRKPLEVRTNPPECVPKLGTH